MIRSSQESNQFQMHSRKRCTSCLENADVQQKLYEEIKRRFSDEISYEELTQNEYLDAVVQETIRLGRNIFFFFNPVQVCMTSKLKNKWNSLNILLDNL